MIQELGKEILWLCNLIHKKGLLTTYFVNAYFTSLEIIPCLKLALFHHPKALRKADTMRLDT